MRIKIVFYIFILFLLVGFILAFKNKDSNASDHLENTDYTPVLLSAQEPDAQINEIILAALTDNVNKSYSNIQQINKSADIINTPYDSNYVQNYISLNNNYTEILYDEVVSNETSTIMKTKSEDSAIKGYKIDNKNYAIHLIACDQNSKSCGFRINGIPTGEFRASDKTQEFVFKINDNFVMKINSITFDYCNNARFCDLEHDAYDLVNITIYADGAK